MAFFIFIKSIITVVLFGDFKEVKIEMYDDPFS